MVRGGPLGRGLGYIGPSQERYGSYFCQVLQAKYLRPCTEVTKFLRQIVFSPLEAIQKAVKEVEQAEAGMSPDALPFLVVFQHGRKIWAGPPEAKVGSLLHSISQDCAQHAVQLSIIVIDDFSSCDDGPSVPTSMPGSIMPDHI